MRIGRKDILVCLLLAGSVLVIYAKVLNFGLVGIDDYLVIKYAKSQITPVLNISGAFTDGPVCFPYRVPLAILSHMLDCVLFGSDYGLHHLGNIVLHVVNVLLVFFVFRLLTGALWKSACVAGLFAVHPINVSVVAWLPARVTPLSAVFFLLTIILYSWYAARPTIARHIMLATGYLAGLLAKPSIIYLPFVLLLIDFWPLERWRWPRPSYGVGPDMEQGRTARRVIFPSISAAALIREKIPLFFIMFIYLVPALYFYISRPVYGVFEPASFLKAYLFHAPVIYFNYFLNGMFPFVTFFPNTFNLSAGPGAWELVGAVVFLASVTVIVLRMVRTRPYLALGWFWFLGAITIPVALNVFRHNTIACRYAYLPEIGVFVMLVWGGYDLGSRFKYHRYFFAGLLLVLFPVLMMFSWRQAEYLRNMVTYADFMIQSGNVSPGRMYYNLGDMLLRAGKPDQAAWYYKKALNFDPGNAHFYQGLGLAYVRQGNIAKALTSFKKALELDPGFASAHNNLANLLSDIGLFDDAIVHYRAAIDADPGKAELYNNLATVLALKGNLRQAVVYLKKALKIDPGYKTARKNLERILNIIHGAKPSAS